MPSSDPLIDVLKTRFALNQFRKGQREIIESVLKGKDTLAVMPTGGGKSLCYQLPALCRDGIVLVISPLIALMDDQVRQLTKAGIASGCLHSGQSREEKARVFAALKASSRFILYLSPERVQKGAFAEWIAQQPISLIAIDESHCISQWGPDFRQDYYKLKILRELRSDVPILALTATATPMVLSDISRQLQMRTPDRHTYGFYRPNLYYQVESCAREHEKLEWVRSALQATPSGRVLVYCGTRRQTEELVGQLQGEFPGTGFYHAGMAAEERTRVQSDYSRGAIRILAATNAFGMGIDHPDVRLVVHYQMPANIESFYQEMGRAGRDGEPSTCLLLYAKKDKGLQAYFIEQAELDEATSRRRWRALDTIVQFSEGGGCRHAGILTYFQDSFRIRECGHCDVCAPDSSRRIRYVCEEPSIERAEPAKVARSSRKRRLGKEDLSPLSQEESLRAEVLRGWRKEYADEHDIPAFLVFSDKTLRDLVRKNPKSLDELEAVYGFGPHKLEHLGSLVLAQLESCSG